MHHPQPSSSHGGGGPVRTPHRHDDLEFPFCPDSNKYEKLAKIGQGTFGYLKFSHLLFYF